MVLTHSDIMRSHKLLYMTGKGLEKAGKEIIFKPHGLTMARFMILHLIKHTGKNGVMRARDLQKCLDVSAANMTGRIDVLERDVLVRREIGSDRRTQKIVLTIKGKKLLTKVEATFTGALMELYAGFTEEEVCANIAFMTKILVRLDSTSDIRCEL